MNSIIITHITCYNNSKKWHYRKLEESKKKRKRERKTERKREREITYFIRHLAPRQD